MWIHTTVTPQPGKEDGFVRREDCNPGSLCCISCPGSFCSPVYVSEHGFTGYSPELLRNNTLPDYSPGESFSTVFGVFFPAATGIVIWILLHIHVRGVNVWFLKLRIISDLHVLLECIDDFRDGLNFDQKSVM